MMGDKNITAVEDTFFEDIKVLAEGMNDLAESALLSYKEFAEDVIRGRVSDVQEIERQLDSMLGFCFNDKVLLLYKSILRKLYNKHPDTVNAYVRMYFEMYENDSESID